MSETPRTDNQLKFDAFFDGIGIVETVEVEFARQLETELAEVRAEIERLKGEHEKSLDKAKNYTLELSGTVTKQACELADKDKLIEQMREALKRVIYYTAQEYYREDEAHVRGANKVAKAALAAERKTNEPKTTEQP